MFLTCLKYRAWEDQRRRQCYIFHLALLRREQCYMNNHIAHLVRKLGMQVFYGIDTASKTTQKARRLLAFSV